MVSTGSEKETYVVTVVPAHIDSKYSEQPTSKQTLYCPTIYIVLPGGRVDLGSWKFIGHFPGS